MTNDNKPIFRWENSMVFTNYEVWVDNDPDFSTPEVDVADLADNTYTSPALADGTSPSAFERPTAWATSATGARSGTSLWSRWARSITNGDCLIFFLKGVGQQRRVEDIRSVGKTV
jgi:hypothetical protein